MKSFAVDSNIGIPAKCADIEYLNVLWSHIDLIANVPVRNVSILLCWYNYYYLNIISYFFS